MSIGSGQHVWVRMWGPNDEVVADGVLMPGSNIDLVFADGPQLVARWSLTRVTRSDAEQLAAEKGVAQELGGVRRLPAATPDRPTP